MTESNSQKFALQQSLEGLVEEEDNRMSFTPTINKETDMANYQSLVDD